ncbi:MAG TPA: hypothetical protein PKU97_17235 [Kofleriaceae bacterium]|nr:hypothetical protein [Kofleriaceae bacterium]
MRRPAYCTAKADDEPCLAPEVVLRLASGALAPLERRAIERRIDECEMCRRFVAEVLRQSAEAKAQEGPAAPSAPSCPWAPTCVNG